MSNKTVATFLRFAYCGLSGLLLILVVKILETSNAIEYAHSRGKTDGIKKAVTSPIDKDAQC